MKIKLTLVRPDNDVVDLSITAEPTSSIADIARELHNADPKRTQAPLTDSGSLTLRLHGAAAPGSLGTRQLDAFSTLTDSPLANGAIVSLAPVSAANRGTGVAAILRVVEGVDAGKQFSLPLGSSSIGREPGNRVALSDPLVSKLHARLNVAEVIEMVDAGSANGTLINDQQAGRASLVTGDRITVGDTVLVIETVAQEGIAETSGSVNFNRSPRLDPRFAGVTFKAPEPPDRARSQRLPYLALLAPLGIGVVLLVLNPGDPLSLIFIALSPLLLVAGFFDNLLQGRKQWRGAKEDFLASTQALDAEIDGLRATERAARVAEAPSAADVLAQGGSHQPLLWTRRPADPSYLQVRLGLGAMPSRSRLELPGQRKGSAELWETIEGLRDSTAAIDSVPVIENFASAGSIGCAGPIDDARAAARGVAVQIVGLHSPAELIVTAISSSLSAKSWDWLKWLPHVGSTFSPLKAPPLATGGPAAAALISELEELVLLRLEQQRKANTDLSLPTVVLIVEDDAPADRARLVGLAERGPAAGVHLLWVAATLARIPAACRTYLDLTPGPENAVVAFVYTSSVVTPVSSELVTEKDALAFARSLSPVVDAGARVDDSSDLPRSVSLLQIIGTDAGSETEAVIGRWQETNSILTGPRASAAIGKARPNLRAVFGQSAAEPFALDLRTDGPHALVGGTTGSGKSEFLQAWVLGLATAHSPQRVSFLFVDYKGGAAFDDCLDLPHTVGLVTDLSPHLVRRALVSLRAELRYRENLFNRKKVKDIVELERTGDPDVPPSLVIVVDEFAALATEMPEFVDGVVDVAQRGRSLGLHLILATQRPSGVIRDNLRSNTNLRVALRMADESDSDDVLGDTMAAGFDSALPGRAAAKTGPGKIRVFQSGYAGGWTSDTPEPSRVLVEELVFGIPVAWLPPADPVAEQRQLMATQGPTDIKRMVSTIRGAASAASLPEPRKPWLPELARVYDFSKLPNKRTDDELLIGVVDAASTQSQPTVSYVPDRDGNMAIIGTGGSGKSTALRTIAVSSAITMRGGPVQVYGLDFATGGLHMLRSLPHVGSIIAGEDEERVARLLRWLRDLVDDRAVRFAEARAGNIVEYRKLAGRPDEARILLLLDGMGAFREAYESNATSPWFSVFSQIATDGRQVGVHVIVTGDRAAAIPMSLSSSIQRRLVLRMANNDDYGMLGVDADVLTLTSPPGRGILDGHETQVAVLGGDGNVAVQAREIDALGQAMANAGIAKAVGVERLADLVPLAELYTTPGGLVPIGVADDDLRAVAIDPIGPFIIGGPPGSGRTTAVASIAQSLSVHRPGTALYLLSPRRSSLTQSSFWREAADTTAALEKTVASLAKQVESGTLKPGEIALFLENLADFAGTGIEFELERVVKALLKQDQFVVGEAETSTWSQAYTLGQPLRAGRKGLLVQPDDTDGDLLLNTSTGRVRRGPQPPGRGFLIGQGRARKLQVAISTDATA